nr:hypothetical protein [Oxalobacter aliiformigenes]
MARASSFGRPSVSAVVGTAVRGQGDFPVQIVAGRQGCRAEEGGSLGTVQDAAAAEGDDEVAGSFPDGFDAGVAFPDVGIGGDAAVCGDECAVAVGDEPGSQSVFFEGGGGDQDAPFFSCLADFVFQAGDRAVAEVDGDGLPGCPAESLLWIAGFPSGAGWTARDGRG